MDHDGFDTPSAEHRRWTTEGIAEMVPGVLPPLRWDVNRLLLEEAVRTHDGLLGVLPVDLVATGRSLVGRVGGHVALDADIRDAVRTRVDSPARLTRWLRDLRAQRARRQALWEAGTMTVATEEALDLAPDPATLDDVALLVHRRRFIDLGARALAAEVGVAAAALAAVSHVESVLTHHLGDADEATRWTGRVTTRPDGTVAGFPRAAILLSLRDASADAVAVLSEAGSWPDAEAQLAATPGGAALADRIRHLVHRAGSAAVFGGPTWEEQPDRAWRALVILATAVRDGTTNPARDLAGRVPLDDLLDGLAAHPEWRRTRWLTAQVVDVRRLLLQTQAEDASALIERRERVKAAVLALGGVVRRIHLELGRRLVVTGALEHATDVELLGERELVTKTIPDPTELARRREWLDRWERTGPAHATRAVGEELHGWAAAPGRVTGSARVLRHVDDDGLEPGDVLVARTTDASWTPWFLSAAGIVVEEGGPLSHAAVVARELGIPAVVGIPGVTARLTPGDEGAPLTVTVDGDRGLVVVHQPASAEGAR